jgi:hypothetical protein
MAPEIPSNITPTEDEYQLRPRTWKDMYERKRPVANPFCTIEFPLLLDLDLLDMIHTMFLMAKTPITAHMK